MYSNIVFSGGSLKCLSFLGSLRLLEEKDQLNNIKNLIGSSFGAIILFYVCIGYSSVEIERLICFHLKNYPSKEFDLNHLMEVYSSFGIDDGSYIIDCVRKALHFKFGCSDITFIDLIKKTGKHFVVCVANISKFVSEYMSVDTYPDMSVLLALQMTIAVPFIFRPVKFNSQLYVDGGLFNNFPTDFFCEKTPLRDTLGISISTKDVTLDTIPTNLFQYIRLLVNSVFFKLNQKEINSRSHNVVVLYLDSDGELHFCLEKMKFEIEPDQLKSYIEIGYNAIKDIFYNDSSIADSSSFDATSPTIFE